MKLKTNLLFLLFFCSITTFAQKQGQELIDSLLQELPKAKEDTNKVNLLIALSLSYQKSSPDKAKDIIFEALNLAEKITNKKSAGKALLIIGSQYAYRGQYDTAMYYNFKCLKNYEDIGYIYGQAKALYNICITYTWDNNLEKAIAYSNKLSGLPDINNEIIIFKSGTLSTIGTIYSDAQNYPASINYWEQAIKLLEKAGDTTHKYMAIHNNIGLAYYLLKDCPRALKHFNRSLEKSFQLKDTAQQIQTFLFMGRAYGIKGEVRRAIYSYNKGIEICDTFQRYKEMNAVLLNNLSGLYASVGLFDKALYYSLRSLKMAEEMEDEELIAVCLNDITIIYKSTGQYDKGLQYLLKSLQYFEQNDEKEMTVRILENIGVIYSLLKNNDSAIFYFKKSIAVSQQISKESSIGWNGLGEVYVSMDKEAMALEAYSNAIRIAEANYYWKHLSIYKANLAKLYLKIAQSPLRSHLPDSLAFLSDSKLLMRSTELLNYAIKLSIDAGSIDDLKEEYKLLSEVQEYTGNYDNALLSYKQYIIYRDSIYSIDKIKEITKMDLQYNFDKKEAATAVEYDKQIALEKAEGKARLMIGGVSAISLIILLTGGFYFYRRRENDKMKIQMAALKQEALNAQMSDHFITNSMDSINYFIKSNDREKASEYLIRFSRLVRNVLENATEKTIPLNDDLNVLKDFLELEKLRFEGHLEYQINIDPGIDTDNMLIPPMVFQTLAENAIKHGFTKSEGGRLSFTVSKEKNTVLCSVEDNGIGRKASLRYKDNTAEKRTSLGSGIAEKLVKTVSRYSKETSFKIIDLFDNDNRPAGTQVNFSLPYMLAN